MKEKSTDFSLKCRYSTRKSPCFWTLSWAHLSDCAPARWQQRTRLFWLAVRHIVITLDRGTILLLSGNRCAYKIFRIAGAKIDFSLFDGMIVFVTYQIFLFWRNFLIRFVPSLLFFPLNIKLYFFYETIKLKIFHQHQNKPPMMNTRLSYFILRFLFLEQRAPSIVIAKTCINLINIEARITV